jgi:hypothetical protein
MLPFFDIWPFHYEQLELKEGGAVPPYPDYEHYEDVSYGN